MCRSKNTLFGKFAYKYNFSHQLIRRYITNYIYGTILYFNKSNTFIKLKCANKMTLKNR